MSTLIINKQSISVKLEANHLVLHEHADGGSFQRVPLVDIDRVIIVGQPAITFPVLAKLMDIGIPCSFLTSGGKWRGLMDGDGGFHAQRRILQYERSNNEDFALKMVRRLVAAKIANCRRTIQRFAAERQHNLDGIPQWKQLKIFVSETSFLKSIDSLRGLEGIAANFYFQILSQFFPDDMPFLSRTRRPPRDPANAVLSFCYVLLANTFTSVIRAHGLDVSCGFFHRGNNRSPALALDLMEPFRPALADRLTLNLLNHHRLRASDHFEGNADEGVRLNEQGRKIVFVAYDEMMRRRMNIDGRQLTVQEIIEREVCHYLKAIEGQKEMYFYRAA
jgi:CRISPR-associated protein Cas1